MVQFNKVLIIMLTSLLLLSCTSGSSSSNANNSSLLQWTKQVGYPNGETNARGVSSDSNNNVYLSGYTSVNITGQTQTGTYDYFIAKYNGGNCKSADLALI